MAKFRRYTDFTAQGINVKALMSLYGSLERNGDRQQNLIPFVVFLAFSVESYLNSLGARKLEIWDELERLPWRSKVEILHKVAGKSPEWGKEPLQFATEVFKLRDKLAHGKPERVLGRVILQGADVDPSGTELQPEWYSRITKQWVLDGKERFRVLMTYLGSLFGFHDSDHLHLSSGGITFEESAE